MDEKTLFTENQQLIADLRLTKIRRKSVFTVNKTVEKLTILEFLSCIREFSIIPRSELQALADCSRFISYETNQFVRSEGDEKSLYGFIVVTGRLTLFKTSNSGKDLIVDILQPGDNFGLLLKLANENLPEQLSVRAIQKAKLLLVPIKNFRRLIETYPLLCKEFVAHLLISLQSSYNLSRGLAHDKVNVRIATVLIKMSLLYSKLDQEDTYHTVILTRQQLANLTGTTTETAIRITRAMQNEGLIDLTRSGIIKILKIEGLIKIVDDF